MYQNKYRFTDISNYPPLKAYTIGACLSYQLVICTVSVYLRNLFVTHQLNQLLCDSEERSNLSGAVLKFDDWLTLLVHLICLHSHRL